MATIAQIRKRIERAEGKINLDELTLDEILRKLATCCLKDGEDPEDILRYIWGDDDTGLRSEVWREVARTYPLARSNTFSSNHLIPGHANRIREFMTEMDLCNR